MLSAYLRRNLTWDSGSISSLGGSAPLRESQKKPLLLKIKKRHHQRPARAVADGLTRTDSNGNDLSNGLWTTRQNNAQFAKADSKRAGD